METENVSQAAGRQRSADKIIDFNGVSEGALVHLVLKENNIFLAFSLNIYTQMESFALEENWGQQMKDCMLLCLEVVLVCTE